MNIQMDIIEQNCTIMDLGETKLISLQNYTDLTGDTITIEQLQQTNPNITYQEI